MRWRDLFAPWRERRITSTEIICDDCKQSFTFPGDLPDDEVDAMIRAHLVLCHEAPPGEEE